MIHFDWIKRHAERTPSKLALVDAETGNQFTYAEFDRRIGSFAAFLRDQLGIRRGDPHGQVTCEGEALVLIKDLAE